MSDETQNEVKEEQASNKEINFRAYEAKMQKQFEEMERQKAQEIKELRDELDEFRSKSYYNDDDESYVDKKNLQKAFEKFGEHSSKQTKSDIQNAIQTAIREDRQGRWLQDHKDFEEVITKYANKFAEEKPDLANSILTIQDPFEKQKAAYLNIKALGMDQEAAKTPSMQEQIDNNKKPLYYQPSGVGTAPYAAAGNFSKEGQKQAYSKMKELQQRLGYNA